jgi:hypothetical protein
MNWEESLIVPKFDGHAVVFWDAADFYLLQERD